MKLPITLLSTAEAEFDEDTRWYESRQPGLGRRFVSAVEKTFERIRRTPQRFEIAYRNIRRAPVAVFPYGVYYRIDSERIVVVAVFFICTAIRKLGSIA